MSNVLNVGKKAVSVGVVFSTMLWSVGVAALLPVAAAAETCPTFKGGDMVQAKGQRAIYTVDSSGKLLYFPSGDEFKSWNSNDKYENFTVVSQSCFDVLYNSAAPSVAPYGVNFRPGSFVLKRPSSPQLYVVELNNTLQKISADAAKALYGANYKVMTVADVFWPNYKMSAGAEITEAKAHPGMLVSNGGKTWLVDADSSLREVTAAGFTANRFKQAFVHTLADSAVAGLSQGAAISAEVAALADRTQTGGTQTTTPTPVGGNMTVSLAANTPASATIIADSTSNENPQAMISFTSVNFTAGSAASKVTSVKFNRTGIATDADLGNLYLFDGETKIAEYSSFNNKMVTFSNSAGLFTVAAGTTKTITLKGDLARASTSVSSGKTIGFAINAASDVTSDGTVGGSFPVSGNLMTTTQVSDLGHVYISGTSTFPASAKSDDANKEFWRFTATADSQDMEVSFVKFTMVGTVAATDIKDLKLEVGGVQVGATQQLAADNTVAFNLATPVLIKSGQSKIFVLRGTVAGGSGRVFKFTLQKSSDLVVRDTSYGVFVTPNAVNTTGAFTLQQPTTGTGTSVESGTLTVGVATDSPTGNIADGATNLTVAKFNFTSAGEAVKIDNLSVSLTATNADGGESAVTLQNVKLLLDGSQIGTTATTLTTSSAQSYTFGNTFVIPAGTTRVVSVVADTTHASVEASDTLSLSLSAGSANATGQTTFTSISTSAASGRTLTVRSGTAAVAINSAFANRSATNPTGVANATEARVGSFIITAGAGEAIDVTQIALADDSTYPLGNNFQNLKLKNGTTQIGSTVSNLNTTAGSYTFTPATAIRIAAGQQYVVDVYADIKGSPANSATTLSPAVKVSSVTATGANTTGDASYTSTVSLQNGYIAGNGNLTVALDSDSPSAGQLIMGATDVTLAKFKLTADAAEAITINDLTVSDNTSSGATGTLKNVKLFVDGQQVGQTVNFSSTDSTSTYSNAVFTAVNLTIPRNTTKVVTVKADVTSYDDGGTSGSTHALALLANKGSGTESITAQGSTGSSITAGSLDFMSTSTFGVDLDVTSSQQTAYRTGISVAFAGDTPSGSAVGGTGATVAKIVVTNSSNVGNYDATIKTLNFAVSQTGISNTADRTLKVYKDSISAANQLVSTSWLAAGNQNFGDTAITDANFTDVNIAAGSSKTFIVTLDTNDAGTNDKLSVNVDASDVEWSDGVTSSITSVPGSLPLQAKTLSY